MKQNVLLILVGVLIGAMLMTAMPSGAHHSRSLRQVKDRLHRLESAFGSGCSFGDPVTWGSSFGNMFGDPTLKCEGINGSDIEPPFNCSYNDPAVWDFSELGC